MTKKDDDSKPAKVLKGKKAVPKAAPVRESARRRQITDDVEDDEVDEDDEAEESDDDLFDSDEEREISERNKSGLVEDKKEKGSLLGKRKAVAKDKAGKKTRSRLDDLDDEDEDDDEYRGDDDEDGEVVDDSAGRSSARRRPEETDDSGEAELKDYKQITLRRCDIETDIYEPFFDAAVIGHFVKVCIGEIPAYQLDGHGNRILDDDGKPKIDHNVKGPKINRFTEIVDVVEGSMYKLENGKETTKRLKLAFGQAEKTERINKISNSGPVEKELIIYLKENAGTRGFKPLTKMQVRKRRDRVKDLRNHTYTNEDVNNILLKEGKGNLSALTFEQALENLEASREMALANSNDFSDVVKINSRIELIKQKKDTIRMQFEKQNERQANLNKRKIAENMRKDNEASKKVEEQLKARGDAAKRIDPFLRRETRPRNLWIEGMKSKEQDAAEKQKAMELEEEASKALIVPVIPAAMRFDVEGAQSHDYMAPDRVHSRVVSYLRSNINSNFPDPIEETRKSQQQRYVEKLHRKFPQLQEQYPRGSDEREVYRQMMSPGCISLEEYAKYAAEKEQEVF